MTPQDPGQKTAPMFDPSYVNAMAHFYRGELARIMVWRGRLDVTTTWAVTTTTSIVTVAFAWRQLPHLIFFFNIAIVWMMLWIESRRYRFYDAFRARVRMLEAHFLVPMVMQNHTMLDGEWQKLVCEDLLLPSFKISSIEAVGRRLKRNYIFIFAIILVAWVTKIILHAPSDSPVKNLSTFYNALAVQPIPAWFVAIVFVATYVAVIGLTIFAAKRSSEEISEFGTNRTLWHT